MNLKFIVNTAFRDSRKNLGKLAMFMASIVLGIGALVAINSFHYGLVDDIDKQAAALLGADLAIRGNTVATDEMMQRMDEISGEKSSQIELLTMALISKTDETQFVRIKALEGNFPYYGKILTEPENAAVSFKTQPGILVEQSMMLQYNLELGDSIQLGDVRFPILGSLLSSFGVSGFSSSFASSIYLSQQYLQETKLVQPGSLIDYGYYFKSSNTALLNEWVEENKHQLRKESYRSETIQDRKDNLNEAFGMLNQFLNLIALVSLLLGCIGVASSVYVYVKSKVTSIAILRCLGMKGNHAFLVFWLQIFVLGFIAVLFGTVIGSMIQTSLPFILSDFLPFDIHLKLSWKAVAEGIVIGTIVTGLFALLPLLTIRNVSPLRTLRTDNERAKKFDWLYSLVVGLILIAIFGFLFLLTSDFWSSAIFTLGIVVSFLLLFLVASLLIFSIKKFFPRNVNFVMRHGLANLFRPNNQTQTLLISVGLGTAVLTTLYIIQSLLLNNVSLMDAGNQPNMILYGIETHQVEPIKKEFENYNLPTIQDVPIVTMKLEAWKGKTKSQWLADSTRKSKDWAINRETRVTYRDTLDSSESLIDGTFIGTYSNKEDSIFISLGDGYAEDLDVGIGDELVFNVQGMRLKTYVSSIRSIDFTKMQTRFFIVFPTGVLEQAPQFTVLVTKTPNDDITAQFRSAIVKQFPNVSVIDVAMVLKTLNDILNKVSYVIQFMALFSILTGLIVLISSLVLSKYQRIKESVLLRTLGASKSQIRKINMTEYFIIGSFSAITGIVIALVVSFLVVTYQFQLDFAISWLPIFVVYMAVVSIVMLIGFLNLQEVIKKSPLAVLRNET